MKVLVLGGTGTVGSQVARDLQAKGVDVGVLSRDVAKVAQAHPKATALLGDLKDPATVRAVFMGYEGVFMANAVSATEVQEGLQAVIGARMSGVKKFVYMSIHNLETALFLPHFGSKIPIEMAIKTSGMAWTILRPNNFHQNDYWYKDALLQYGIYPQPLGSVGTSRVDIRDIADAAVAALTSSGHDGQTYNLVGPDVVTGRGCTDTWSRALGKTINYGGEDMDAWEKQNSQWFPAWMVFDFRLMYEFFQKEGLRATPADIERLTKVLGHAPRGYEEFVRETAKAWLS